MAVPDVVQGVDAEPEACSAGYDGDAFRSAEPPLEAETFGAVEVAGEIDGVTAARLKEMGLQVFGESEIWRLRDALRGKRE